MAKDASTSSAASGQSGNRAIGPEEAPEKEPFVLWWMPLLALLAPLVFALWNGASADDAALKEAAVAFFWPGVGLYLATLAVLWAGWKIDLE